MGKNQRVIEEVAAEGWTFFFPNDKRGTVVLIGEEIYNLVPAGMKLKDIINETDFSKVPHVRRLNPIPARTTLEQEIKNKEVEQMHDLSQQVSRRNDKVTSLKKAGIMGADVPKEIDRLLAEKKEAQKKGDEKAARLIRRQLRALDYKRYLQD